MGMNNFNKLMSAPGQASNIKVQYKGFTSSHTSEAKGVCCQKDMLQQLATAFIQSGKFDQNALQECQKMFESLKAVEKQHLGVTSTSGIQNFYTFCAFVKSDPDRETLLGMRKDNVCPVYADNTFVATDTPGLYKNFMEIYK